MKGSPDEARGDEGGNFSALLVAARDGSEE